jgi:hypothetical protein
MKTRFLCSLVGLAISLALPTFAQQTNTPDPQLREELLALTRKFDVDYKQRRCRGLGRALHGGRD